MRHSGVWEEHVGAFAGDHIDALQLAQHLGGETHRALSCGAVHPHLPYAAGNALRSNLCGDGGGSEKEHAFDGWSYIGEARETGDAVYLAYGRIYRNYVIAATPEFGEEAAGEIVGIARYADRGEAFPLEKLFDLMKSGPGRSHKQMFLS